MKFTLLKNSLALALLPFLSGCFLFPSVDHTGLLPADIEGQVYSVNCRVDIDHLEVDDLGNSIMVTSVITEMPQVCSDGAPTADLLSRSCEVVTMDEMNLDNYVMQYGGDARVSYFEALDSALDEDAETCFFTNEGGEVISRTDMLTSTASSHLRPDEVGKILAKNTLTNSLAEVVSSEVTVGAKFLKWRFAQTTATGQVEFDRFNCEPSMGCDLVVRHISLELDDFTIVRPTVFARDVPVRSARLYSITSHATRTDADGRFQLDGVNAIITSVVDGEKVTMLSTQEMEISGQFNHNLHNQNHAALTLKLQLAEANKHFSVKANADFHIKKFPSKLAVRTLVNGQKTWACLTGGALAVYREARISQCDLKRPYQAWYLEEKGRYLRIRQPLTNTCLNVKSGSQNYDGGIVSIVNCSDHWDQLWAIDNDFNVVNLHTRKCLDVGRNKNRGDENLVTIHSCESKADGQDWTVRRPG